MSNLSPLSASEIAKLKKDLRGALVASEEAYKHTLVVFESLTFLSEITFTDTTEDSISLSNNGKMGLHYVLKWLSDEAEQAFCRIPSGMERDKLERLLAGLEAGSGGRNE